MAFACLGVVYGDIGTSPLYMMRACFDPSEGGLPLNASSVLGVLSMVTWSLILVVSIQYLAFIMRADNQGEGGILALLALLLSGGGAPNRAKKVLIALGLFGTALIYGDGMITPAISVLGAVEGLTVVSSKLHHLVVPISVGILIALFAIQKRGTASIARLFSPITLVWFVVLGGLGLNQVIKSPEVLAAINPVYALKFMFGHPALAVTALGFVFLAVTGCEALYADMGHFGKSPIRIAWFTVALPGLLLNYFGQGSLLLAHTGPPEEVANPFYALASDFWLYPLIGLATAAAVVAAQAIISGAFSLTRQALQLGYIPRLTVIHTSRKHLGQIYVPSINFVLAVASCLLVVAFRSSGALAAAYGIAVVCTMLITTLLFIVIAPRLFGWSRARATILLSPFLLTDSTFLFCNLAKIPGGGWVPLSFGLFVYLLFSCWQEGRQILSRMSQAASLPLDLLLDDIREQQVVRVPGTAVFMSADSEGAPLVLLHHFKHNKVLHETVVLLSIQTESVPHLSDVGRVTTRARGQGFYQVHARYGFMETPDVPEALAASAPLRPFLGPLTTTYCLGRQTLFSTGRSGMARWRKRLFCIMHRNSRPATDYFGLPPNRVMEIGAHVQF